MAPDTPTGDPRGTDSAPPAAASEEPGTAARYDFRIPTRPTTFYAVAATSRSGSTYLCSRLWATRVMGAPAEYFNYHGHLLRMAARLRPNTLHSYLRQLFRLRTSPNGMFGFHAHWEQFRFLRQAELLRFFPRLRFIHIRRLDRLAQAVSMAKAEQTGQWISTAGARRTPRYDAAHIRSCLERIERLDAQWERYFGRRQIRPIRVTYEELVARPDSVVDGILGAFGLVRDPAQAVEAPERRRQSDATNREWIERFRRDTEQPSAGDPA